MVFTKRFIRSGLATASLAFGLLLASPTAVMAQEKAPSQSGGAAAVEATEPVLVVTLGSISKLTQDVNYITGVVGQPQAGGIFGLMAGTFTQGLDTTQPIGIFVPLVNGVPKPLAMIPTADVKSVLARLEAQTGPADELPDGTLAITVGASMVFIQQQGNWAVLAPERDLLAMAPADPLAAMEGMGNDYDLALRMKMQQIPAETRATLTAQIRQGFEQAMAQQASGDTEAARKMAENSMAQFDQLINDTDELSFGFNIDQSGKQVVINGAFTAVAGSELASIYGGQHAIPSNFSSVIRNDAAAFYHAATSISPDAVEQSRASLDSSLETVRNALKNEDSLSDQQREDINELIDRVTDLSVKSIAKGRADMGALLLADESDFRFVFGSFVADGNEAAQIVKDLAKKVENEPKAPRFKFDQSVYNGVTMHLIEADVPAKEDEARRVFGDVLRVHVGTGAESVYLAVGNNSEELMKQLIDSAGEDQSTDRPVGQLQLTLMPILAYAQSIESNDALGAMIDALSRAPDQGQLTLVQENIENGQEITTKIGEGLLQAIGAAARQAQQAQMQGGQF